MLLPEKVAIHAPGWHLKAFFDDALAKQLDHPFVYLRRVLADLGYEMVSTDDTSVDGSRWVWFWNATGIRYVWWPRFVSRLANRVRGGKEKRNLYDECVEAGLQDRLALFTWEPRATFSRNWDLKVHQLFPIVMTWNDDYVDSVKYHKFCIPLAAKFPNAADVSFEQRKLLVNISGNKFASHPNELYTARRSAIRYFEQHLPADFDLYGTGWNDRKIDSAFYPSYRGSPKFKWDVLPRYRFALCYENSCESGYVTEKIFDCLRSGCVPVYWGAPNIVKYVDEEVFIDRRRFHSNAELAQYLASVDENKYCRFQEAIRRYLSSDRFEAFLPRAFAANLIRVFALA